MKSIQISSVGNVIFSPRRQAIQEGAQEILGEPRARWNRLTWDESGLYSMTTGAAGLDDSCAGNVMIPWLWPVGSGYALVSHPSSQHNSPFDHQLEICWSRRQLHCEFHRRFHLIPARPLPHYVLRGNGVPAAPHHSPKPSRAPVHFRWVGKRSDHGLDSSTSELEDGQRSSVQLIEAEAEINDVHQYSRLVTDFVVVIKFFCSASNPPPHISALARGMSAQSPGQHAARPVPKLKWWWCCSSQRLRV